MLPCIEYVIRLSKEDDDEEKVQSISNSIINASSFLDFNPDKKNRRSDVGRASVSQNRETRSAYAKACPPSRSFPIGGNITRETENAFCITQTRTADHRAYLYRERERERKSVKDLVPSVACSSPFLCCICVSQKKKCPSSSLCCCCCPPIKADEISLSLFVSPHFFSSFGFRGKVSSHKKKKNGIMDDDDDDDPFSLRSRGRSGNARSR